MALIVDDLLLSPVKALMWVFKELYKAAAQEMNGESENITNQLSELYMMLEAGTITEAEFEEKEGALLDRLDELELRKKEREKSAAGEEGDEEGEDGDDEEEEDEEDDEEDEDEEEGEDEDEGEEEEVEDQGDETGGDGEGDAE